MDSRAPAQIEVLLIRVLINFWLASSALIPQFEAVSTALKCHELYGNTEVYSQNDTSGSMHSGYQIISELWFSTVKKFNIPKDALMQPQ